MSLSKLYGWIGFSVLGLAAACVLLMQLPGMKIYASGDVRVGDIIEFGNYDWRVLEVRGNQVLILTDRVIVRRRYHHSLDDITWETSEIRRWLNEEFFNRFSQQDQARIAQATVVNNNNQWLGTSGGNNTTDRVFLLSLDEVVSYLGDR